MLRVIAVRWRRHRCGKARDLYARRLGSRSDPRPRRLDQAVVPIERRANSPSEGSPPCVSLVLHFPSDFQRVGPLGTHLYIFGSCCQSVVAAWPQR